MQRLDDVPGGVAGIEQETTTTDDLGFEELRVLPTCFDRLVIGSTSGSDQGQVRIKLG